MRLYLPTNTARHPSTYVDSMQRWFNKTKSRVFHKKSKRGCIECRKRHIKCNEKRPTCRNCEVEARECCFAGQYMLLGSQSPATRSSIDLRFTSSEPRKPPTTAISRPPIRDSDNHLTSQHLSLFHHVETSMADSTMIPRPMTPIVQAYINSTLSTSYLTNQLLAFSAQHLSKIYPDQGGAYHDLAIRL
ncbi:hypothetical protein F4781DRAFT_126656 [Annulohypoxylon bovei var. microspora]|nr:hypothetical protein F4781DRAFT_126656 [Annulohypoxylon bovei var. microspora]